MGCWEGGLIGESQETCHVRIKRSGGPGNRAERKVNQKRREKETAFAVAMFADAGTCICSECQAAEEPDEPEEPSLRMLPMSPADI